MAMLALDSGRIGIASQAGESPGPPDERIRSTKERRQFGKSINSFQAIQFTIADAANEIEAASWLTLAALIEKTGLKFTREASTGEIVRFRNS